MKILIVNGSLLFGYTVFGHFKYKNYNIIKYADHCDIAHIMNLNIPNTIKYTFYDKTKIIHNMDENELKIVWDNQWDKIHSKTRAFPFYPYALVCLADYCHKNNYDYDIFDIDAFLLKKNRYITINNYKNYIIYLYKYLDNIIDNYDIIFYRWDTIIKNKGVPFIINKSILNYLKQRKPTYVGGKHIMFTYTSSFSEENCKYIIGRNLNDFHLNEIKNLSSTPYLCTSKNLKIAEGYSLTYKDILNAFDYKAANIPDKKLASCCYTFELFNYCNNSCAFCAYSKQVNYDNYTYRYNNFDILKLLYNNGFNTVCCYDCNILSSEEKLNKIEDYLDKNNMDINFVFGVSLLQLNEKKLKRLKDIGMKIANIGIESLDTKVQKLINKKLPITLIEEKLEMLAENNIGTMLNFITDLPLAQSNEVDEIERFIVKNDKYITACNLFSYYLSGDIACNPKKYGIKIIGNGFYHLNKGLINLKEREQQIANSVSKMINIKKYTIDIAIPFYICLHYMYGAIKANKEFNNSITNLYKI